MELETGPLVLLLIVTGLVPLEARPSAATMIMMMHPLLLLLPTAPLGAQRTGGDPRPGLPTGLPVAAVTAAAGLVQSI